MADFSLPTKRRSLVKANKKQSLFFRLRLFLYRFLFLSLVVMMGAFTFTLTPRKVNCITNEYTYCPAEVKVLYDKLNTVPWIKWPQEFDSIQQQVKTSSAAVVSATWSPNWRAEADVNVTIAEELFPFVENNQPKILLSNGEVQKKSEISYPRLEFSNHDLLSSLSKEKQANIGLLYHQLENVSPRVKKIIIQDINNIEVYTENQKQFLMRADLEKDVLTQVTTLQSFLRSSTMNPDYQIIDLRFNGQVIVRE